MVFRVGKSYILGIDLTRAKNLLDFLLYARDYKRAVFSQARKREVFIAEFPNGQKGFSSYAFFIGKPTHKEGKYKPQARSEDSACAVYLPHCRSGLGRRIAKIVEENRNIFDSFVYTKCKKNPPWRLFNNEIPSSAKVYCVRKSRRKQN